MEIFSWNDVQNVTTQFFAKGSALTIGCFDGIHLAHQKLFYSVLEKKHLKRGVVTFSNMPHFKTAKLQHNPLFSLDEKIESFEEMGFDFCVIIDFSVDFSRMKGIIFIEKLFTFCKTQFLAIGNDFRCGVGLDTGLLEISNYAEQNNVELFVLSIQCFDEQRISSTAIRDAISQGDLQKAQQLLGKPFYLNCKKFHWQSCQGSSSCVQIPTSEITQILPKIGKYSVWLIDFENSRIKTVLSRDFDFLRLEIPHGLVVSTIQKIEFNCLILED